MAITESENISAPDVDERPKESDIQWADGYTQRLRQSTEYLSKWNVLIQEFITKTSDQKRVGTVPNTVDRLVQASNIFLDLNNFWNDALKDLPNQNACQAFLHPWIQALPEWNKQSEKLMNEDLSALDESLKLSREVYNDTLGRFFEMPGLGLAKQHTEAIKKAQAEFARFASSLPFFYQYLHKTQVAALREVFDQIRQLKIEDDATPEKMREIYKIWLMTNERAFHELFKRTDFCNTTGEVLNCVFRLKKRLDELTNKWCEALSIPSSRDYDQMAMAVQGLRRKVRSQEKMLETLQRKIDAIAEKGDL